MTGEVFNNFIAREASEGHVDLTDDGGQLQGKAWCCTPKALLIYWIHITPLESIYCHEFMAKPFIFRWRQGGVEGLSSGRFIGAARADLEMKMTTLRGCAR